MTSSNLGFDYTEKTAIAAAKKQFRASGDIRFPLWLMGKGAAKYSKQLTLEFSGQGQWGTKSPVYQTPIGYRADNVRVAAKQDGERFPASFAQLSHDNLI